ncbi:hypothetical protein VVR12_07590 [Rothia sp. LK2588]|uniref:hypothetical protein n=1 Tax=Rothia sp. LK2588 TaxID=3114369 RepID=UPI0034CF9F22
MGKKKIEPKLPKSVKRSESKVQERFVKAFEKSVAKHGDTERALDKAQEKLEKKYEKVDKVWVPREDDKKTKKADSKKKEAKKSDKKAESKKAEKKSLDKKKDAGVKKADAKKAATKKKGEKAPNRADLEELKKPAKKNAKKAEKSAEKPVKKSKKQTPEKPQQVPDPVARESNDDTLIEFGGASEEVAASAVETSSQVEDSRANAADVAAAEAALTTPSATPASGREQQTLPVEVTDDEFRKITRAELYREATALSIRGRSRMSKLDLFNAVKAAKAQ